MGFYMLVSIVNFCFGLNVVLLISCWVWIFGLFLVMDFVKCSFIGYVMVFVYLEFVKCVYKFVEYEGFFLYVYVVFLVCEVYFLKWG